MKPQPPLTVQNGYGRCLGCNANLRGGQTHQKGCPIEAQLKEAAKPALPVHVVDARRIARELANKVKAERDLKERMELDRVAAGVPRKKRKASAATGASPDSTDPKAPNEVGGNP